ncbi:hypothetical protein GE09DRAFT_1216851 [Coniochaeta sp. 2T2.1]|nr:hypothetical protein GE09DRAFT_1216851 [Coniochaeta sp. 2T2.1]
MAPRTRFFEECPEDDCLDMLGELEDFASAPTDDVREISDRLKADRERAMRKWNYFFKEVYTTNKADLEEVWFRLCHDDEQAKFNCKVFLQWYVKKSGSREVCLGPAEYEWKREVTSAITLTELWKRLVVEAHSTVLFRKRKEDRVNRRQWALSFAEKGTGPVAEISRWIAGPLSRQLSLTTEQTFVKQQTSPEDIALFLDTLWTRSADIPLTASTRIAFHTFMLVAGIGGFRNGSILNLPYKQVRFALVRDPDCPSSSKIVAHILIVQNKRRKGLRRNQDDKIEFSVTFVPGRTFCLSSFLVARALADNAFDAEYQTYEELLDRPILEPGIDYLPLPFKTGILDRRIIPLGQEKLNDIWNRTLLVAGLRQSMKPYSLRVGAAGRLNGVLEPTLRNYILSQSSSMFHHSYQARNFSGNLAIIAFGGLGGDSGDAKLFKSLSNSSLSRDERAPVNPTAEDLAGFERRRDIQDLRQEMREAVDQGAQNRVSKRIANIIKSLSRLRVQELREAYFQAADQRRGQGLPADNLAETSTAVQSPATRVGQFLRFEETSQLGNTRHSPAVGKLLLDLLQNRLSPLSEEVTVASSEAKTLPAITGFEATAEADQSSSEPEAVEDHMIDGAPAWSNHVETYHGKNNAPNLPRVHQIWHKDGTSGPSQAWCLICSNHFQAGRGFVKHLGKHKDAGVFAQPFQCIGCPEDTWIDGLSEWIDHSARCHGGCSRSGAGPKRACEDGLTNDRDAKKCKVESGQGYGILSASQLADSIIPIDPALWDS